MKGNKKGYFKYISSKKLTKETLGLLFKEAGNLEPKDIQKLKLLSIALISEVCSQASQVLESSVYICGSEILSTHLCAVIEGSKFSWWLVTIGIPHGSVLGQIFFNNFINILKNGTEFAFKFTNTNREGKQSIQGMSNLLCSMNLTDWSYGLYKPHEGQQNQRQNLAPKSA